MMREKGGVEVQKCLYPENTFIDQKIYISNFDRKISFFYVLSCISSGLRIMYFKLISRGHLLLKEDDIHLADTQGYSQWMRLQGRLYGIYAVSYMIPCHPKLLSFFSNTSNKTFSGPNQGRRFNSNFESSLYFKSQVVFIVSYFVGFQFVFYLSRCNFNYRGACLIHIFSKNPHVTFIQKPPL